MGMYLNGTESLSTIRVLGFSDLTLIQIHMLKLFDNVKLISFAKQNKCVSAMNSSEGEGLKMK